QNARGRSYFQGRYVDTGKVAHFVRTSRAIPPSSGATAEQSQLVMHEGRSRVSAPVKVTTLAGDPPLGLEPEVFRARAERAIAEGLGRFEAVTGPWQSGPADRAFYLDFYPYLSADGTLYVATALFSQFNCIEPVYRGFDDPVSGPWAERAKVFTEAARRLEDEVLAQILSSEIGDGFDPLPATVPVVTWEDLGLPLPEPPPGVDPSVVATVELARRWRIAQPSEDHGPRLVFRFPSPLERYSGEVTQLDGELELAEGGELVGAVGRMRAATGSVTMGEPSLDGAIHGKMIHVDRFPESTFVLEKIRPGAEPVAFGTLSRFVARGTFTLVGRSIPVEVRGQLEPIVAADGRPRLKVSAAFRIRLADPFGIAGPEGPSPAR
ncbi:MAG: YceI family protein, partial [Holophagales bacterium]|nr:YceI family protein [Holophagales bacterium]